MFLGTTNDPDFLQINDRRYWPIEVYGKILVNFVREHRDAIWAEAVAWALMPMPKQGEDAIPGVSFAHWLNDDEEASARVVREAHAAVDPWTEAVRSYCSGREEIDTAARVYLEAIAVGEDGALSRSTKIHTNRVAAILKDHLGCVSLTRKVDGKTVRYWRMSDTLRHASCVSGTHLKFN